MLVGVEFQDPDNIADSCTAGYLREADAALRPPIGALTLTKTAEFITDATGDTVRLRLFFEFCRGADEAGDAATALVSSEPPLTGFARFDALLAAIADNVASRLGAAAPRWAENPDRFLTTPWWVSPLPSARIQALRWTPTSFRRRGIYLDRADLGQDGITPLGD
jgi:hypothetical protein